MIKIEFKEAQRVIQIIEMVDNILVPHSAKCLFTFTLAKEIEFRSDGIFFKESNTSNRFYSYSLIKSISEVSPTDL